MLRTRTGFINRSLRRIRVNVTSPSAVTQIRYCVERIRVFIHFVWSWFIVIGMATSAIGLECGVRIDWLLHVGVMANRTIQVAVMFDTGVHMGKHKRRKAVAGMADITLLVGDKMSDIYSRSYTAIVATGASTGHYINMVKHGIVPACRVVTVVTLVAASNVCRMLARCYGAIMATLASPNHLCVIHGNSRCKHHHRMTVFTYVGG